MLALVFLVTGFPWILGWLLGVGLLVSSPLWSGRQKLLGILVWPGGYAGAGLAVPMLALVAGSNWVLAVIAFLLLAPLAVAAYLYRAAGRQADAV